MSVKFSSLTRAAFLFRFFVRCFGLQFAFVGGWGFVFWVCFFLHLFNSTPADLRIVCDDWQPKDSCSFWGGYGACIPWRTWFGEAVLWSYKHGLLPMSLQFLYNCGAL